MDLTRSIVVGYDDTSASAAAVRWAAALARSAGVGLRIVHAWSWPLLGSGLAGVPVMDSAGPRNQATQLLDAAAEAVRTREPEVPVQTDLLPGTARDVLDQISQTTQMLVVGTRGLGPVLSILLGSVSQGILHDAGCPVAVIRSEQHRAGPVLVAVDGSPSAAEAVEVAADLAHSWATTLRVVHVLPAGSPREVAHEGPEGTDARTQSLLDEASAQALAARDGIRVETRTLTGRSAADGLLAGAAGARILVMGHRGYSHGPLGSTVHATVLHATGNVVVVRRRPAE